MVVYVLASVHVFAYICACLRSAYVCCRVCDQSHIFPSHTSLTSKPSTPHTGLHDLETAGLGGPFAVSPANYTANLKEIWHILAATGAEVIWRTTTPVLFQSTPAGCKYVDFLTGNQFIQPCIHDVMVILLLPASLHQVLQERVVRRLVQQARARRPVPTLHCISLVAWCS